MNRHVPSKTVATSRRGFLIAAGASGLVFSFAAGGSADAATTAY
jgi:hypothetical protein